MTDQVLNETAQEAPAKDLQASRAKKPKQQALPPIELLYRQIYDVQNNEIYGYEAMMQINDRKMGTLLPALFLPVAEKSNQIVELGKWSLVEIGDMIRRRREKGRTVRRIFLSVSPKYLRKTYFLENVERQLQKAEMEPRQLCLLLKEEAFTLKSKVDMAALKAVQDAGLKIVLDGFGTESSSLMQLGDYAPDYIKLDEDFVSEMETNDRVCRVGESVLELAEKLNIQVIASGVQTKSQLSMLEERGCTLIEGTYFDDFEREKYLI